MECYQQSVVGSLLTFIFSQESHCLSFSREFYCHLLHFFYCFFVCKYKYMKTLKFVMRFSDLMCMKLKLSFGCIGGS